MTATLRQRAPAAAVAENGTTKAAPIDEDGIHHEYEFGGPVGVTGMMIFFPSLFYYIYACLYFYDGECALCSGWRFLGRRRRSWGGRRS